MDPLTAHPPGWSSGTPAAAGAARRLLRGSYRPVL